MVCDGMTGLIVTNSPRKAAIRVGR